MKFKIYDIIKKKWSTSERGKINMENKKIVKLNDEDLGKVDGGYMLWAKTCKVCGGVISNDPETPDNLRCHCNDDTTPVWGPKPR